MESTHQQSSLLVSQPTLSEFTYSTFLQDEEANLGIEEAYSNVTLSEGGSGRYMSTAPGWGQGSAGVGADAGAGAGNGSSTELARTEATGRKVRMERRGHTKSRRGCYNCKRRRIKCQETRPACGHCIKTGLQCEYPSLVQIVHQVRLSNL
ncbi:hypothetical protein ACRALDRAFT_1077366 [Sodiomyces alcalophilus JCM 7366]|uniref:uncharacterized protein n=1 Tax=Sodiomyces alcalophilus JCM 7366 TaxID=591952 RepID=UPI0039B3F40F